MTAQPIGISLTPQEKRLSRTLVGGALLPLLDTTLVNVALTDMGLQIQSSLAILQWIVTAYLLAAASAVSVFAWLVSCLGARRIWLVSLWLFLGGSVLSAIASSVEFLIPARVLQGFAAGLLLPAMQTIVLNAVEPDRAKAALAAIAIPSVIAPIAGAMIGGLMIDFIGWRLIFWTYVPVCMMALKKSYRCIPDDSDQGRIHFDLPGFLLLCPALFLWIYGLSRFSQPNSAIDSTGLASVIAGIGVLVLFIRHALLHPASALLDLSILRKRPIRRSCALLALASVAYYGGVLLLPLYLLQAGGYTTTTCGIFLAMHGVGTLGARHLMARNLIRASERSVASASILAALSGALLLASPAVINSPLLVALGMLMRGAGIGALTLLAMAGAYSTLKPAQIAHASALTRIVTYLAAAVAATGVISLLPTAHLQTNVEPASFLLAHGLMLSATFLCGLAIPQRR